MVAAKSSGLERLHIRMPNGSLVNSPKPSAGRKRRGVSFVTEIARMAILSFGDFGRWVFGIVQPRHSDFNLRRPHSSLGYLTPAAFAANLIATDDRLRNPDQLRRSSVANPAPHGAKHAEALIAVG